jgi:hypothetical protein
MSKIKIQGLPVAERVNYEFVDKYLYIYQLMSFNMYILLFLP